MTDYDPKELEKKGVDIGEKEETYRFIENIEKKKLYILDMFPYPSGSGLHVGHLKGYLATDILTRFYTMRGYNVFHPMGGDAFGLPAEQYAISTGNSPEEFTNKNIDSFRKQLKRLALTYDFSREVNTSDPEYYKYTQKIFSEMYKHGLAELRDTTVNGCEELNTVLSDEEIVEKQGKFYSERGNYAVTCKVMKQGILRITDYANELYDDIDILDGPENIKKIQKEGIGKNKGYVFELQFKDKIYPLYLKYASSIRRLIGVGIHQFSRLSKELDLTDFKAGNREALPIVLKNLTTGENVKTCYLHNVNFRSDDLIPIFEGKEDDFYDEEIEEYYVRKYKLTPVFLFRLKDGVFSRQRFGGEPIPIIFDKAGIPKLDENLPVRLPKTVDYLSKRFGGSPLESNSDGVNISKNGEFYKRETNTMPNGAGSSGYFIAYLLKKSDGSYYDLYSYEAKKILAKGLPVDIYIGGQEHAAMHLLYARFGYKFLNKLGIVSTNEPFKTLFNQGMILGSDGTKMSKSKDNYVSIDEIVEEYGSDALRSYEAFSGPTQLSFKGEEKGIKSCVRGLNRVHLFFEELDSFENVGQDDIDVAKIEARLVSNVSSAIPQLKINLGISELMIFMNEIQKIGKYYKRSLSSFVQILSFYAPALAEELGRNKLNHSGSVFNSIWPEVNLIEDYGSKEFKVFWNGKFKFTLTLDEHEGKDERVLKQRMQEELGEENLNLVIMVNKRIILAKPI